MLDMKTANGKRFGQAFTFKKKLGHGLHKGNRKKATLLRKGQIVDNEINELKQKIDAGIDPSKVEKFTDFPLSKNTLAGLKSAKYTTPTDIQKQAISAALQGKDVLGAAKTGSGKTLAFLIPVLEVLYKSKMSATFGMAALIITPTRELAFQIFEVLNKIRGHHDFSANLIIGGKHMWREENLMRNTNIVICTPGRLLHHLDQTRQFNADELQILVLDEADRIMDSKFAKDMDNIIGHLPVERQTLLFSATQTKSVKDLARLSLKDPAYVSVHEHAQYSTPSGLEQSYVVCELHEKLSFLFSFLKNHPNNKILVFLHTCKQVRFVYSVMKRERPGMTVLQLYGRLNQLRRIDIYRDFCRKQHVILFATDIACRGLDFPGVNWVVQLDCPMDAATYIHRAGRTARFERNGQALLVLLPSEEEHMVQQLQEKKIPIKKIRVNNKLLRDITGSVAAACAENQELKDMAERAYRNYVYSISMMKNKKVFDVSKLDLEQFAKSLGLFKPPKLRFLLRQQKAKEQKSLKTLRNVQSQAAEAGDHSDEDGDSDDDEDDESSDGSSDETSSDSGDSDDSDSSSDDDSEDDSSNEGGESGEKEAVKCLRKKHDTDATAGDDDRTGSDDSDDDDDRTGSDDSDDDADDDSSTHSEKTEKKKGVNSLKEKPDFGVDSDEDADNLLTVKRTLKPLKAHENVEGAEEEVAVGEVRQSKKRSTKAALVKRMLKKGILANTRLTFDDDGNVIYSAHKRRQTGDDEGDDDDGGINVASAAKRLRMEDKVDKALERERVKQKHREERLKKKEQKRAEKARQRRAAEAEEEEAVLSGADDADDPFQYIPDPDTLAARKEESESSMSGEDAEGDDDSDDDGGDDGVSSGEDEEEDVGRRSSLEDAALHLLQINSRRKK